LRQGRVDKAGTASDEGRSNDRKENQAELEIFKMRMNWGNDNHAGILPGKTAISIIPYPLPA
jgi:hypothetical protein